MYRLQADYCFASGAQLRPVERHRGVVEAPQHGGAPVHAPPPTGDERLQWRRNASQADDDNVPEPLPFNQRQHG